MSNANLLEYQRYVLITTERRDPGASGPLLLVEGVSQGVKGSAAKETRGAGPKVQAHLPRECGLQKQPSERRTGHSEEMGVARTLVSPARRLPGAIVREVRWAGHKQLEAIGPQHATAVVVEVC